MNPDAWGCFHDGEIIAADGLVPGQVTLTMRITYLRRMFPQEGDYFLITLDDCTHIQFAPFQDPVTTELAEIARHEPMVLYVREQTPLKLDCANGVFEANYGAMSVALDSGQSVSEDELEAASRRYWDDWERRGKAGQLPGGPTENPPRAAPGR